MVYHNVLCIMYYIILHDARMARSKHLSEAQDQLHDSVDLMLIPVARGSIPDKPGCPGQMQTMELVMVR